MEATKFCWMHFQNVTFYSRLKLVLAMLATPLTLLTVGHSPFVTLKYKPTVGFDSSPLIRVEGREGKL